MSYICTKLPICVKCQREFQKIESGIKVIDMFSDPPKPYRIWLADLFECPTCKTQIVHGFGHSPLSHYYETDFDYWLHEHDGRIVVRNFFGCAYQSMHQQEG